MLVFPRPKRITRDSNFKGTEPRKQLLLIFNTKTQGNSEGKDILLARLEIGNGRTRPQHLSASQCILTHLC